MTFHEVLQLIQAHPIPSALAPVFLYIIYRLIRLVIKVVSLAIVSTLLVAIVIAVVTYLGTK